MNELSDFIVLKLMSENYFKPYYAGKLLSKSIYTFVYI